MTAVIAPPAIETLADLLDRIGDIPPRRLRTRPPMGTATEADVLAAWREPQKRLCELVEGVLVEKAMGAKESELAGWLIHLILSFPGAADLGAVLGEAGALRLLPGLVRIPDVSFISRDRLPGGELPDEAIPDLVPDLAVEILSQSNTKTEMKRKLLDYFQAGVRLVWLIQPKTQTAEAYAAPTDVRRLSKNQALDGEDVIPGFTLPLKQLFAGPRRRKGSK